MKKVKLKYKSVQVLPQTVTDAVMSNDMQRSLTDILAEKVSKVGDDTVAGELTMAKGVHSDDYEEGMSGYKLGKNADGSSYCQVDVLKVLKRTDLNDVRIASLKHVGGTIVASPASCKLTDVAYASAGGGSRYICYFLATDGESTATNDWEVDDLALCKLYTGSTPRFYWRRVTDVSMRAVDGRFQITLSATDCAEGSGEPAPGDEIVCFGNVSNSERQNAIILSSSASNAPIFLQLTGISGYSVDDSNKVTQLSPAGNIIRGAAISFKTKSGTTADLANIYDCGVDIENGTITLSANNTIVKGDLSVQRVMTYYPDGAVRSAYNGNGNGTIVYYYPNGNKMREDVFEYDAGGNAIGMSTIYYKADGSISWKLTQSGFETTLSDYWTYEEGMAYSSTLSEVRKAIAAYKTSGSINLPTSVFSTFVATSGSLNQSYNGRVVQGRVATSAMPKPQTPYTGYYFDPSPMQRVAEQGSSATIMFFRVKYVNNGKVESITDYDVI